MKLREIFEPILHPRPLRQLDEWLLKNQPNLWRLKVHRVAVYALVAGVLLFAAGYFTPIGFYELTTAKYPEEFFEGRVNSITFCLGLFAFIMFFVWRSKLAQFPATFFSWRYTLIEIFLIFICQALIFTAVLAYGRGISLKKKHVAERGLAFLKSRFEDKGFYFPAYLPHWFPEKKQNQEQYFRQGEQLLNFCTKRASEVGSDDQPRTDPPIEFENAIVEHLNADSIQKIWADPKNLNLIPTVFETADGTKIENWLERKYLFFRHLSGLTFEEGNEFLKKLPTEIQDTFPVDEFRPFTHKFSERGESRIFGLCSDAKSQKFINDTTKSGTLFWFAYDYFTACHQELKKIFAYKCFLESLDANEKSGYRDYLHSISEPSKNRNSFQDFENQVQEQKLDQQNLLSEKDALVRSAERFVNDNRSWDKAIPALTELLNRFDEDSKDWYKHYLDIKTAYPETCLNDWQSLNQQLTEQPKPTDSLLLADYFFRNKYYLGQCSFSYDRYLDYYFKKLQPQDIASLREYVKISKHPLARTSLSNDKKALVFAAFDSYEVKKNAVKFLKFHHSCWKRTGEGEAMLCALALFLAIFIFFLANISTDSMIINFAFWAVSGAAIAIAYQFSERNSGMIIYVLFGVMALFAIGLPALATIIFLWLAKSKSRFVNFLIQLQILIIYIAALVYRILTEQNLNEKQEFLRMVLVLLYHTALLLIIAVLYRKNQSLPSKA